MRREDVLRRDVLGEARTAWHSQQHRAVGPVRCVGELDIGVSAYPGDLPSDEPGTVIHDQLNDWIQPITANRRMSAGLDTTNVAATNQTRVLVSGCADFAHDKRFNDLLRCGAECHIECVSDSRAASEQARSQNFDVIVFDVDGDEATAFEALESIHRTLPDAGILVVASRDQLARARTALHHGAQDYLLKPCDIDQAAATIRLVGQNAQLRAENRSLSLRLQQQESTTELVGCSPAIRRLSGVIARASDNDATVLIEGKEGTGKTLVARLIHMEGKRSTESFTDVQSEALTEAELEDLIRPSKIGTLLIENVEGLTSGCQSRLVRYLKERAGSTEPSSAGQGQRVVATTSARLAELTARGSFREDLYYRLNVFPVVLPSLSERREDVTLLVNTFLRQSVEATGMPDRGFTAAAMILMETHPWPGNVAQLRNSVFRAHALASGGTIDRVHLLGPTTGVTAPPGVAGLTDSIDQDDGTVSEDDIQPFQDEEKRLLTRALRATKGNVRRAAQLLGIGRATLYRKIQVYDLRLQ